MKCQRVRREVERIRDLPGGQPFGTGLNQQPEHGEAVFLRERGQGRDSIGFFHISIVIEIWTARSRVISIILEISSEMRRHELYEIRTGRGERWSDLRVKSTP